jgi:anti-sigma regulatory factor (Ser/Thr protein kinase)
MSRGLRWRRHMVLGSWAVGGPESSSSARMALQRALTEFGLGDEAVADAVLAVSELVANAGVHATGPYELRVRRTLAGVVCEVRDRDSRIPVVRPRTGAGSLAPGSDGLGDAVGVPGADLAESGRGLQIVDHLSEGCWGFRRVFPRGKVAWVAFPLR